LGTDWKEGDEKKGGEKRERKKQKLFNEPSRKTGLTRASEGMKRSVGTILNVSTSR